MKNKCPSFLKRLLYGAIPVSLLLATNPSYGQVLGNVTPNPVTISSPTSLQHTQGYTATVTVSIPVTNAGGKRYSIFIGVTYPPTNTLPDTIQIYGDGVWSDYPPGLGAGFYGSYSGNQNIQLPLRMQLNNANTNGSFSGVLRVELLTSGTQVAERPINITITNAPVVPPTMTTSSSTLSFGTVTGSDFSGGYTPTVSVTSTISDQGNVGTTLYVGLFNPYTPVLANQVELKEGSQQIWTIVTTRDTYSASKSCTTNCTQTWSFRKTLSWTGDPPGGPYVSQIRFQLRKTSDGTVLSTRNVDLSLSVGNALVISLSGINISFGTITQAGPSVYYSGSIPTTVTAGGNRGYTVYVKADNLYWTPAGGVYTTDLDANSLQFKKTTVSVWRNISTSNSNIDQKFSGSSPTSFNVEYRLNPGAAPRKDTYTIGLTYSIIAS